MTDEAKAIGEVAKFGQEVVKAAVPLGSYVGQVLGTIPHNVLGILAGDWLSQFRTRRMAAMADTTAGLLERISRNRIGEPSPALLLPLLQAGVDEGREELQGLWAGLLANTMLDGGRKVRRSFIEALQKMDPLDAHILKTAALVVASPRPDPMMVGIGSRWLEVRDRVHAEGVGYDEISVSAENLQRLGCLEIDPTLVLVLRPFGKLLFEACQVE